MYDIKTIRQQLWVSMDMDYVRRHFITLIIVGALAWMINGTRLTAELSALVLAIVAGPLVVFLLYRTWKIFHRAEGYILQEAVLNHPTAGWGRGAIRFTVTVKDSLGHNHRVDTHSIFVTYGLLAPSLDDYVNRKVRVAYNSETGTLVVIA